MYRPSVFDIPELDAMRDIIDGSGPAQLVSIDSGGRLAVSVVPMLLDRSRGEFGTLIGHLARPNPHWRDAADGESVAIFNGPDAYVSPALYPSKRATGKVVPTWNYVTINAHGPLVVHDDREFVLDVVTRLTTRHEGRRSEPWAVTDAPSDYIDAMLRGIVGIELPIVRLEGKSKLSQNKSAAEVDGVIAGLEHGTESERDIAALMREASTPTTGSA